MPSLGIVPGAERTTDESLIRSSPGRWVDKRATNECEVPPLDIGVQAIQLSPYRSGVAGPLHTRLLRSPVFQSCACPLALSGPGEAVASESSALNSGLLWRQFTPCVTWRTVSVHPAPQQRGVCHTYLGNQSPWLFSYRDNVDATVARCLSHPSLRPFWAGCDRLPSCPHP
jgi:hypothetical protein